MQKIKIMTAGLPATLDEPWQSASNLSAVNRISDKEQTPVLECIKRYGDFIWILAKHFTNSDEEAEAATRDIFIDIWKHAEERGDVRAVDKRVIVSIARSRLIKLP